MGLVTEHGDAWGGVDISVTSPFTKRRSQFLRNESGGDFDAIGDYSVTPATFSAGPSAGEEWLVYRAIILIEDVGGFAASEYGNGSELTNGWRMTIHDGGGEILDLQDGHPFTTNANMGAHCYDVNNVGAGGGGDDALLVRWTFSRAGSPLHLFGDSGHKMAIVFNDDFSGLTHHSIWIDAIDISA